LQKQILLATGGGRHVDGRTLFKWLTGDGNCENEERLDTPGDRNVPTGTLQTDGLTAARSMNFGRSP
jgi:hypothetical protein